ncbi:MAG: aspartate aminotransferase family protein [Candidatus Marinimicrobia bacterium]|nr:aspartate aminotransferase family protein [Candidatus Neomarinimicrobiota bacterium]
MKTIPEKGLDHAEILKQMQQYGSRDVNYHDSKTWSLVYHLDEEHTEFLKKAYNLYFSENALNPMAFKSLKRFETEVINMTATMLHGDKKAVGTITSGGTESCLLPVLTYRDMARSKRKLPFKPEMVVPESVHVAWTKAAKYFGVKIIYAPLKSDFRVDVEAVRKLINRRTVLLVGSAPSYPHGVIDPIAELSLVAQQFDIPLHVDACLGGFLLPFMEKNGEAVPEFDFRLSGVTSISADVHKYGFAAKGASTVIYRSMKYMKHQFFVHENWPGGIFASPALLGTRPGGAFAAAWAAMHALGEEGYCKNAREIMEVSGKLQAGIKAIDGLRVMGHPDMSVFGYHSTDDQVNIFAVGDQMEALGWHIDRLQQPEGLHIMVVPGHAKIIKSFLSDLENAVDTVRSNPDLAVKGSAAMYGMVARLPFRGMIKKEVMKMMEELYSSRGSMPMGDDNPWSVRVMAKVMQRFKKR